MSFPAEAVKVSFGEVNGAQTNKFSETKLCKHQG